MQPRALSEAERATVIDTLHSEAYCDQPPAEAYQRLLEQGQYLCSVSTIHQDRGSPMIEHGYIKPVDEPCAQLNSLMMYQRLWVGQETQFKTIQIKRLRTPGTVGGA